MDYNFMTFYFSDDRRVVRIRFNNPHYYGLERFFNDDAGILWQDIEALEFDVYFDEVVSFAGNRTVAHFTHDEVTIEDQWDRSHEGFFDSVTISRREFDEIYQDWKQERME